MSFDLYAWARPVPGTAIQADDMLRRHYDGDESTFEADPRLAGFIADVLADHPPLENLADDAPSPWAMTPVASDRLVEIHVSWQTDDQVLIDLVRLARKHRVVLYDPQGPDVHSPEGIPRGTSNRATAARPTRAWFPILTVGGALLLCFAIILMGFLAGQAR